MKIVSYRESKYIDIDKSLILQFSGMNELCCFSETKMFFCIAKHISSCLKIGKSFKFDHSLQAVFKDELFNEIIKAIGERWKLVNIDAFIEDFIKEHSK